MPFAPHFAEESAKSIPKELTLDISQRIEITGAIGDIYAALVRRLSSEN